MTKDEILAYLNKKKQLTADAQDARHEIYEAEHKLAAVKHSFKKFLIWTIVVLILLALFGQGKLGGILAVVAFAFLIFRRVTGGSEAKSELSAAEEHLNSAQQKPEYIAGMQDFPQQFYSYWTIDRLMHLVQENRATTLQEAFNVAENQDFQHDQLSLQQQNLAVSESTNKMASVSAVANVFTAFHTRK